jgi:hypothetical protein
VYYRLISFFPIYIISPVYLSIGVYVYTGVIGGVLSMRVLLAVTKVYKVGVRVDLRGLRVRNIGLSVA